MITTRWQRQSNRQPSFSDTMKTCLTAIIFLLCIKDLMGADFASMIGTSNKYWKLQWPRIRPVLGLSNVGFRCYIWYNQLPPEWVIAAKIWDLTSFKRPATASNGSSPPQCWMLETSFVICSKLTVSSTIQNTLIWTERASHYHNCMYYLSLWQCILFVKHIIQAILLYNSPSLVYLHLLKTKPGMYLLKSYLHTWLHLRFILDITLLFIYIPHRAPALCLPAIISIWHTDSPTFHVCRSQI